MRYLAMTRSILSSAAGLILALCLAFPAADAAAGATPPARARSAQGAAPGGEGTTGQPPTAPAGTPVTVSIDPFAAGPPVPQRFLGLSFEAAALPQIADYARRGDLVRLLRSLGPGMLRFGGITSDENVAWTDADTPQPAWASSTIDAAQLRAIGTLARRTGWQVLLTVGLAHYEPQAAAREVAAAHSALGPYLAAVEIGNEPDSYGAHGYRQLPWIAQGYEEEVTGYREAIGALTPGVPIAGPDVSGSGAFAEWGEEEALAQKPALLTGHHYPLGCAQTPPPSIEQLLSPQIRNLEARSLASYLKVSQLNGIPVRIDETNTVSCGGVPGISDTFASALWATAYITQAMAAGVTGINLEGSPANCTGYSPLCAPDPAALARGALHAQPEWYALLLTSSLVGDRPLPDTISAEGSPNLVAAAFSAPDRTTKVVLVDDEPPDSPPLDVSLNLGAGMGAASTLRLSASSQSATDGVLLGDRAVAANGTWSSTLAAAQVAPAVPSGVLAVTLAPSSATLVTVSPQTPPPAARAHVSEPKRERAGHA
jgi:hypothetical protein